MTNEQAQRIIARADYHVDINGDMDSELIDAANMAIEALEAQRWIPVSERLPDTSGYLLVVNKGYLPYIASYHLSNNEFVCDDGVCFPTHWMPLPEQPQEV
jgi:hypothetical protein